MNHAANSLPEFEDVHYAVYAKGAELGIPEQQTYDPSAELNFTLTVNDSSDGT